MEASWRGVRDNEMDPKKKSKRKPDDTENATKESSERAVDAERTKDQATQDRRPEAAVVVVVAAAAAAVATDPAEAEEDFHQSDSSQGSPSSSSSSSSSDTVLISKKLQQRHREKFQQQLHTNEQQQAKNNKKTNAGGSSSHLATSGTAAPTSGGADGLSSGSTGGVGSGGDEHDDADAQNKSKDAKKNKDKDKNKSNSNSNSSSNSSSQKLKSKKKNKKKSRSKSKSKVKSLDEQPPPPLSPQQQQQQQQQQPPQQEEAPDEATAQEQVESSKKHKSETPSSSAAGPEPSSSSHSTSTSKAADAAPAAPPQPSTISASASASASASSSALAMGSAPVPARKVQVKQKHSSEHQLCAICDKPDNLVVCSGPCMEAYHLVCIDGKSSPKSSASNRENDWICPHCTKQTHPCFHCKRVGPSNKTSAQGAPSGSASSGSSSSTDVSSVRKCRALSCGKFYHHDCITKLPLARIAGTHFICPLHTCAACEQSGAKKESVRCVRCPVAYHAGCLPKNCVQLVPGRFIICPKHESSSFASKKAPKDKTKEVQDVIKGEQADDQLAEQGEEQATDSKPQGGEVVGSSEEASKHSKSSRKDKKRKKKKRKKSRRKEKSREDKGANEKEGEGDADVEEEDDVDEEDAELDAPSTECTAASADVRDEEEQEGSKTERKDAASKNKPKTKLKNEKPSSVTIKQEQLSGVDENTSAAAAAARLKAARLVEVLTQSDDDSESVDSPVSSVKKESKAKSKVKATKAKAKAKGHEKDKAQVPVKDLQQEPSNPPEITDAGDRSGATKSGKRKAGDALTEEEDDHSSGCPSDYFSTSQSSPEKSIPPHKKQKIKLEPPPSVSVAVEEKLQEREEPTAIAQASEPTPPTMPLARDEPALKKHGSSSKLTIDVSEAALKPPALTVETTESKEPHVTTSQNQAGGRAAAEAAKTKLTSSSVRGKKRKRQRQEEDPQGGASGADASAGAAAASGAAAVAGGTATAVPGAVVVNTEQQVLEEERIVKEEAKWVQCDRCKKWRTVPKDLDLNAMPEKWYCEMNIWDLQFANCEVPEENLTTLLELPKKEIKKNKLKMRVHVTGEPGGPLGTVLAHEAIKTKRGATPSDKNKKLKAKEHKDNKDKTGDRDRDKDKDEDKKAKKRKLKLKLKEKYREVKWVQCENAQCAKWRVVPSSIDFSLLPATWYCHLNTWTPELASCNAPNPPEVEAFLSKTHAKKAGRRPSSKKAKLDAGVTAGNLTIAVNDNNEVVGSTGTKRAKTPKHANAAVANTNTSEGQGAGGSAGNSANPTTIGANANANANNGGAQETVGTPNTIAGASGNESLGETSSTISQLDDPTKTPDGVLKKTVLEWAQCEKCNKWRKLPQHIKSSTLPDKWYCSMNHWDPSRSRCDAPEESDQEPIGNVAPAVQTWFPYAPHTKSQKSGSGVGGFRSKRGKLSFTELLYASTGQVRKMYTDESSTLSFEFEDKMYYRDAQYKNSSMYVFPQWAMACKLLSPEDKQVALASRSCAPRALDALPNVTPLAATSPVLQTALRTATNDATTPPAPAASDSSSCSAKAGNPTNAMAEEELLDKTSGQPDLLQQITKLVLDHMDLRTNLSVSKLLMALRAPRGSSDPEEGQDTSRLRQHVTLPLLARALNKLVGEGLVERVVSSAHDPEDPAVAGGSGGVTFYRRVPRRPLKASKRWLGDPELTVCAE